MIAAPTAASGLVWDHNSPTIFSLKEGKSLPSQTHRGLPEELSLDSSAALIKTVIDRSPGTGSISHLSEQAS